MSEQTLVCTGKAHPLADAFPMITGAEFDKLVASIREIGLAEPIALTAEGDIADGRNRFAACSEAGVTPEFVSWKTQALAGEDLVKFIVRKNLRRRQLTPSQLSMVAVKLATLSHGGDRRSDDAANLQVEPDIPISAGQGANLRLENDGAAVSRANAAQMLGVSERSVDSAATVEEHGAPEIAQAVRDGAIKVSAAADIARLPKDEQAEIAKNLDPKVIKRVAKDIRARQTEKNRQKRLQRAEEAARGRKPLSDIVALGRRYVVAMIDPAWQRETYGEGGKDKAPENHYPTETEDQIAAHPVGELMADDAVIFVWTTVPDHEAGKTHRVIRAWGFEPKSHYIWAKTNADGTPFIGTGYWNRNCHEILVAATRGDIPAPLMGTQPNSIIYAPVGEHSEKPDAFREMIDSFYPGIKKIELNRRGSAYRDWDAWGDEFTPGEMADAGAADMRQPDVEGDGAPDTDDDACANCVRWMFSHRAGVDLIGQCNWRHCFTDARYVCGDLVMAHRDARREMRGRLETEPDSGMAPRGELLRASDIDMERDGGSHDAAESDPMFEDGADDPAPTALNTSRDLCRCGRGCGLKPDEDCPLDIPDFLRKRKREDLEHA